MSDRDSQPLREIIGGGLWSLLLRWIIRGFGLLGVVLLARLLTPSDFGLVAMASVVVGLGMAVTELGANLYLVRTPSPTRDHCDSAWTLRAAQGAVVGGAVFVAAPLAAGYFGDVRLEAVLRLAALAPFIGGLENIGVTLLLRERRFREEMLFRVSARALGLFVTISLAFAFRDYWALVYAQIGAALLETLLSYRAHPYRPRVSFAKIREILPFSAAVFTRGIGEFVYNRIDVLFVGRIADTSTVGFYNVVSELSTMLTGEIASAVSRAAYPVYSSLSADKSAFAAAFLQTLNMMAAVMLPAGIGLCLVSRDFVYVLLGEPWLPASNLLSWLAVFGIFATAARTLTGNMLLALGAEWWSATAYWVFVVMRVLAVIGFGLLWGTSGIVRGLVAISFIWLIVAIVIVKRVLPVTAAMLMESIGRPLLATAGMAATVLVLGHWSAGVPPMLRLVTQVAAGGFVYVGILYYTWKTQGRPFGFEHVVFEKVRRRFSSSSTT